MANLGTSTLSESSKNQATSLKENYSLMALGLTLAGLVLRLVGLGARPLWFDEVISVVYAKQDFSTLVALNSGDNHPVGYYLTLKGWISLFGTSEAMVRLLSVGPGVVAIWLTWLIGRRLFPAMPQIALVATALTALSPFQIYFSQEARNYSFMEFFGLGAIWFGLRAYEDNRWLNWAGVGLCGALGLVSNLTTAFYLVALGLIPFWQFRRNWQNGILPRLLLTGLGAGLLSGLVLLPKLTSRLEVIKGNFWIPTPNPLLVLRTFFTFIFGALEMERFAVGLGLALIILLLTFGAVLPACYRRLKRSDNNAKADGLLRATWLLFGPLGLIILVSLIFQPLYLDKALIVCAPFYYLLIGWAVFRPDLSQKNAPVRRLITAMPLIAAMLLALAALPDLYDGTIAPNYIARYDASRINAYLQQNARPGDVVASATDISWLPLVYYGPNQLPPKYPIKEYPYPNIFPLLVEKLNSEFVPQGDFAKRFGAKRLWVVFELNVPENQLRAAPHPADLSGEIDWFHSPDWQRDLLAHYDQQYQRLEAIALDRVVIVLYQL
jgi:hypothetical protein